MDDMTVLVIQRSSHVSSNPFSRSIGVRIAEPLNYLKDNHMVAWKQIDETMVTDDDLDGVSVVYFSKHRSDHAVWIAEKAKERCLATIYDMDDWVMSFPGYSGAATTNDQIGNIRRLLELADVVTVSNEKLMHELHPFGVSPEIVPAGFYFEKYISSFPDEASPPRIVFSNIDKLKIVSFRQTFLDVLAAFFRKHPEWVLDFYGDPFPEMESLPFLNYLGTLPYEEYIRTLSTTGYAMAITPLGSVEDPGTFFFNSCKIPIKYIEYGAMGIPGIYSRNPIYENTISSGTTGLVVDNNHDSWLTAMTTLAQDTTLRHTIRQAAHEDVLNKRHIRFGAQRMYQLALAALKMQTKIRT